MACAFFSLMTGMVYGQSAQSIIEKVEANQTYQSISYEGTMEILSIPDHDKDHESVDGRFR